MAGWTDIFCSAKRYRFFIDNPPEFKDNNLPNKHPGALSIPALCHLEGWEYDQNPWLSLIERR